MKDLINQAADAIMAANVVIFSTGAGMGVDSGLPDFRGNDGFWKAYPPLQKLGIDFMSAANPALFDKDPHLAWAFYGHRYNLYRETVPHEGYRVQKRIADVLDHFVHTTNVDEAYVKVGFRPEKVVEIHGNINYWQRTGLHEDWSPIWRAKVDRIPVDLDSFRAMDPLPRCAQTGLLARPNILMFHDWSFSNLRVQEQRNKLGDWLGRQHDHRVVVIECGAGKAIQTARIFSERFVTAEWGQLVRINPREPEGPGVSIPLGAAEAMLMIEEALEQRGFFEKAR